MEFAANGRLDKAKEVIAKLLKSTNHLGLFSEDADEYGKKLDKPVFV